MRRDRARRWGRFKRFAAVSQGGFSLRARVASFGHALRGLGITLRGEHNAWIHAAATIAALALGAAFGVSPIEWIAVVIVIGFVWAMEAVNTAIEALGDAVTTAHHPTIRDAKDAAAGATLVAAATALCVGLVVFGRRLCELFFG